VLGDVNPPVICICTCIVCYPSVISNPRPTDKLSAIRANQPSPHLSEKACWIKLSPSSKHKLLRQDSPPSPIALSHSPDGVGQLFSPRVCRSQPAVHSNSPSRGNPDIAQPAEVAEDSIKQSLDSVEDPMGFLHGAFLE
jgi:hypothetical protein